MDIDAAQAAQALKEALEKFPAFAEYGPRLAWRDLYQGGTFLVEYENPPPRDTPGMWDFQNAVVKRYKQLAGV